MSSGSATHRSKPAGACRREIAAPVVKAAGMALSILLLGAALSTPASADPGDHGRGHGPGHGWGHHRHHHGDRPPVVVYEAPPPVVVVPAPPPRVVHMPPPAVVYAPPPAVVYAPPAPPPGVSVQMNIPLR